MTTIGEILYSDGNSISVFERKLLLSHVLGFSNEKLNLTPVSYTHLTLPTNREV